MGEGGVGGWVALPAAKLAGWLAGAAAKPEPLQARPAPASCPPRLPAAPAVQLCYPEAGYERDEQLLAALRAAPSGQDLRALLHNLIPPPARRPHGGNRRSRAGRAAQTQETLQGAGATAGAGRPAVVPQGGLPAGGHAVHAAAAADSQRLPCVSRRINRGVMEHSRLSVKGGSCPGPAGTSAAAACHALQHASHSALSRWGNCWEALFPG